MFRFENGNCIALGAFNVYIIQPGWLIDQGIVQQPTGMLVESSMERPGFRFKGVTKGDMKSTWMINPDRIIVESGDAKEDCGTYIAKVLEKLPWTPLTAIGNNFAFSAPSESLPSLPPCVNWIPTNPDGANLVERSIGASLERDGVILNVQLAACSEKIWARVNAHHELVGNKLEERSDSARSAAKSYFADKAAGIALLEQLMGVTVSND
ncbi:hypothetical protein K2Y11_22430 [bacterium]|nr:hypothetical protein [bacterium]